jgi:hypothetical protein
MKTGMLYYFTPKSPEGDLGECVFALVPQHLKAPFRGLGCRNCEKDGKYIVFMNKNHLICTGLPYINL